MPVEAGLRYHHIGIPTEEVHEHEDYLEEFKMYVSGYETSPYGVEWLRFEPDSPLPELVKTVPHVAFVVDDLPAALAGKEVLLEPNSPSDGVTVAFIVVLSANFFAACNDSVGRAPTPAHRGPGGTPGRCLADLGCPLGPACGSAALWTTARQLSFSSSIGQSPVFSFSKGRH